MSEISLAMIVKNEEKVLRRCLESVKDLVEEIIVVDTGSNDLTRNIALEYTDKVYNFSWQDNFSMARNYSFSKCTKDYIMWLDADDVFDLNFKEDFLELKNRLIEFDAVMLRYDIAFDESGKPTFSYFRERILKREAGFIWKDAVHEVIELKGRIEKINIAIKHLPILKAEKSGRNLKIYTKQKALGVEFNARQQYYFARELMYNNQTERAIAEFEKLICRNDVWMENLISAHRDLSKCYIKVDNFRKAKETLEKCIKYSWQKAEVFCELADVYMQEHNFEKAIALYLVATNCEPNLSGGGFVELDYYGFYPHVQLCVCYFNMGDVKKANEHNEQAGKIKPFNNVYLHNKKFFENNEKV